MGSEGIRAPLFEDRRDAGHRLGRALAGVDADLVVGLARGGVAVAAEVARALGVELDVLAVRKVGHPWQPEYAIGAVTPGGGVYVRSYDGLGPDEVAEVARRAQVHAEELDRLLHERRPAVDPAGKACLLVDDGLATGATMIAAVRWARLRGARRITVAVPVAPPETVALLEREADAVVCLAAPLSVGAVGFWYADFAQVNDGEVLALLEEAALARACVRRELVVRADGVELPGTLVVPPGASGAVLFVHGSGSSRASPRNVAVARILEQAGLATLLFDLLTPEEALDRANVFDIPLLASRLGAATRCLRAEPEGTGLALGYFGASTGAAAALWAAADLGDAVRAVVSRGGRPDLAGARLGLVRAPTLLIVGGEDREVLALNRRAAEELSCEHELVVVPGATHLFEEPGALERVAELAQGWFSARLR